MRIVLELFWEDVDGKAEVLAELVSPSQRKYVTTCGVRVKAMWYHASRIGELDVEYAAQLNEYIADGQIDRLADDADGSQRYEPFFEAVEFENLLGQGKAFLDVFSKMVGLAVQQSPGNLGALKKVLEQDTNRMAIADRRLLLKSVKKASARLRGIIIDPR